MQHMKSNQMSGKHWQPTWDYRGDKKVAEFPQNMHKHRHIQAVKWSNPNTRQDDPTLAQWPATVVIEKRWENSPLTRWAAPPCWNIGQQ